MVSQAPAIRVAGLECPTGAVKQSAVARMRAALAAAIAVVFALTLNTTAGAATITVNSLADTGATGICVLRDAITAANTMASANGCSAGTGSDTINFTVTGTITLQNTLPQVTGHVLTINGPATPGITISGGGQVQVMVVAAGAAVSLNKLKIADGTDAIDNSGTLTITDSIFSGNSSSCCAGAVENRAGTVTVTNSTFSGNSSIPFESGAIENLAGTVTVSNSTFSRNSTDVQAEGGEGAIDNSGGTVTVSNSTFSDNSTGVDGAGAIGNGPGRLTVTNSTFSRNYPSSGGGAILNSGIASFKSTILAGGANCDTVFGGRTVDAGYNISDDDSCGFSASSSHNNTDPKLDPTGLRNNGGPTQTIALLDESPAIDTISLANCTDQTSPPNPIVSDQRLFPRPDFGEANCDIGAYEFQDKPFIPFSRFGGGLRIDPDAGVFYLSGGFKLGTGGSIDPSTEPMAFSVGSYAVRLPAGSFARYNTGYVYKKTINHIFLRIFIKFTNTPDSYALLANRIGGTLSTTTSPVPVMLSIGDNSGSTQMNAGFN